MKVVINKILISVILFFITAFILSCEQDTNPANPNLTPNTTIANIPVDEDTLFALQTLHWDGEDDDGFIQHYEYRYSTFHMVRGDSFIQDWQMTNSTSLTIPFESSDDLNEQIFEVRAIDNSGAPDPSPAEKRFFTVKTVFPTTEILTPTDGQKAFSIDQTTDWWLGI
ncbi:MAG: hypothetical protein GWN00_26115, partial [Aliifodinibius sp.]|nr:hypothetical protein [Fodinibius sp.]NIV14323.1 hypothetical protein [Fodinibius sp.]NIY28151.1 hypothetical protein [Fodinibius sp.]